jgi:integrase
MPRKPLRVSRRHDLPEVFAEARDWSVDPLREFASARHQGFLGFLGFLGFRVPGEGGVRRGHVFRRCTKCGAKIPERRCLKCGADTFTWAYKVDISDPGQPRRQRKKGGFPTKAAAQEAMSKLQVERAEGTYVDPSRITLGEYLEQWHADGKAHGWEGSTKTEYGISIRLHIKPYAIGATRLQALTSTQFRTHYQFLLREGKIRRNKKGEVIYRGPLSRKTVQNIHICVRSALNDAVAAEPPLLRKNVAIGSYTYSRGKHRPEMLTWTVEEVRAFLAFAAEDFDHALWRTALMTGMRRGELLGLRRRDLMLNRVLSGKPAPALNVRQQYARNGDEGLSFRSLKTGDRAWRTTDLDAETTAVLRAHLEAQEAMRRDWGSDYLTDLDLVFCHPDGAPYDPDTITHRFERRTEVCPHVIRIRFHDQRHTHATLLLEDGATERYVAERLGDTVEMIHETYGHVTPRMRSSAVDRLGGLIDQPGTGSGTNGYQSGTKRGSEAMPSSSRGEQTEGT